MKDSPSSPGYGESAWFLALGLCLIVGVIWLFALALVPPNDQSVNPHSGSVFSFQGLSGWIALLSLLMVTAGMMGAYVQLARDIFTSAVLDGEKGSLKRVTRPGLLLLHLLVGGLAGFIAGLLVPAALVRTSRNVEAFNPAALAILSAATGMIAVQMLASLIDRLEQLLTNLHGAAIAPEAVEAGVRAALAPPALVDYRGRLDCVLKHANTPLAVEEGTVWVHRSQQEFVLDALLRPETSKAPASAVSADVIVGEGTDATQKPPGRAEFMLEIAADDLIVATRTAPLTASTGGLSNTVSLTVKRQGETSLSERAGIQLTLSQAGRMVQVLSIQVRELS